MINTPFFYLKKKSEVRLKIKIFGQMSDFKNAKPDYQPFILDYLTSDSL